MRRKARVLSGLSSKLTLNRKSPQLPCEGDVFFYKRLVLRLSLQGIWSVSGFGQGIAPAKPCMRIPFRHFDAGCVLECLPAGWLSVLRRKALNLAKDFLPVHRLNASSGDFQSLQLDTLAAHMGKLVLRLLNEPTFFGAAENLGYPDGH